MNSKWTFSQTLYIFYALMHFYFLLRDSEIVVSFVLNLKVFLLFVSGTNKVKYFFENSNKIFWVAAISAGRSLEGQQTILGLMYSSVNKIINTNDEHNNTEPGKIYLIFNTFF